MAFYPYLRNAVAEGKTYSEGAFGPFQVSSVHTVLGTGSNGTNDTGIIGLMDAWLLTGGIALDPQFWGGCLASTTPAVAANPNGDCGYNLANMQHIPPPPMVN